MVKNFLYTWIRFLIILFLGMRGKFDPSLLPFGDTKAPLCERLFSLVLSMNSQITTCSIPLNSLNVLRILNLLKVSELPVE